MKKVYKSLLIIITAIFIGINTDPIMAAPTAAPVKSSTAPAVHYINVSPVEVVNNPGKYLNKNITFNAEFVSFSSLGLDYKPAFRDSEKYIGILIKRDDTPNHVIPLSEMKIFIKREVAEKNIDLEQGDKIKLSGKVFSNALGDVWFDADIFKVISQQNKSNTK